MRKKGNTEFDKSHLKKTIVLRNDSEIEIELCLEIPEVSRSACFQFGINNDKSKTKFKLHPNSEYKFEVTIFEKTLKGVYNQIIDLNIIHPYSNKLAIELACNVLASSLKTIGDFRLGQLQNANEWRSITLLNEGNYQAVIPAQSIKGVWFVLFDRKRICYSPSSP